MASWVGYGYDKITLECDIECVQFAYHMPDKLHVVYRKGWGQYPILRRYGIQYIDGRYRQGSIYPASWKGYIVMYHQPSYNAGKRTRTVIIGLLQAVVSLAVAYIMYCGLWMVHYGKLVVTFLTLAYTVSSGIILMLAGKYKGRLTNG